jgi:hypothetical protein
MYKKIIGQSCYKTMPGLHHEIPQPLESPKLPQKKEEVEDEVEASLKESPSYMRNYDDKQRKIFSEIMHERYSKFWEDDGKNIENKKMDA